MAVFPFFHSIRISDLFSPACIPVSRIIRALCPARDTFEEHSVDLQVALGNLLSRLYICCHEVTRCLIAFLIAFSKKSNTCCQEKKFFRGSNSKAYIFLLERSGERQPSSQSLSQGKGPENEVRRRDEWKEGSS